METAKIFFHIPEGVSCVIAAFFTETGDVLLSNGKMLATAAFPDGGNLNCLRALNNRVWAVAKNGIELYWIETETIRAVTAALENNGLSSTQLPPERITQMLLDIIFHFTEPWSVLGTAVAVRPERKTLNV